MFPREPSSWRTAQVNQAERDKGTKLLEASLRCQSAGVEAGDAVDKSPTPNQPGSLVGEIPKFAFVTYDAAQRAGALVKSIGATAVDLNDEGLDAFKAVFEKDKAEITTRVR
jgi:hypothetical protein